ncbi:MAG: TlpA family protein disulfide reductase [Pseudobutyrivibrio sp.]|nr:TlpA family protein disulfide reductase [Pseudobutyrivibrio sp.]
MMKRYVSLLIAALLSSATLLACGGGVKTDETVDNGQQETVDDTQEIEKQEVEESEDEETDEDEHSDVEYDSKWILGTKLENLDKEETDLTELISGNKVTMLNFWGTYCGPCIGEMSGLERIYKNNKDKGFGIVGMTVDIVDIDGTYFEEAIEDGKKIVKETGVTYPVLIVSKEMNERFESMQYVPTTFIVDSKGNLIGEPIVGAKSSKEWQEILDKYLD